MIPSNFWTEFARGFAISFTIALFLLSTGSAIWRTVRDHRRKKDQ